MIRIEDNEYFLCPVELKLVPHEKHGFTEVEAKFFYEETKFEEVKHVPNFTWWVTIDIYTNSPEEALKELRKEKYECQGASETF